MADLHTYPELSFAPGFMRPMSSSIHLVQSDRRINTHGRAVAERLADTEGPAGQIVYELIPVADLDALRAFVAAAIARDDAVHAALDNENVEPFASDLASTTTRFHSALDHLITTAPAFLATIPKEGT